VAFPARLEHLYASPGFKQLEPKVIVFDVLPNKANYIGTFIHRSDSVDDQNRVFKLSIINEYDKCKSVFLAKHPIAEELVVSRVGTLIPFEIRSRRLRIRMLRIKRKRGSY
jgi:hypothetical protein